MRLFVALDIDPAIRQRLEEFVNGLRAQVPGVRFVGPETFHVTLKFLGETARVEEIERALAVVRGAPFEMAFRGCGFFPSADRSRVFWAGIEAPSDLRPSLPASIKPPARSDFPERGPYTPHLTLARAGSGNPRARRGDRPDANLQVVHKYLSGKPSPEFGTMTVHEFFLYESILSARGATSGCFHTERIREPSLYRTRARACRISICERLEGLRPGGRHAWREDCRSRHAPASSAACTAARGNPSAPWLDRRR